MATPENKVKEAVRDVLDRFGCYRHSPVQNGMGAPSLDFVGCFKGLYFAVETKAPGKKPTPRQEITISAMRKAGGKVFVIDGDTSELENWLNGEC